MGQRIRNFVIAAASVITLSSAGSIAVVSAAHATNGYQHDKDGNWFRGNFSRLIQFFSKHSQEILNGGPLLHEHVTTVTAYLKSEFLNEPDQAALSAAVDQNNAQIADTINVMYPGTHDQFLQAWQQHITYYTDYLNAAKANDAAGKQAAKNHLSDSVQTIVNLLGKNDWHLDKNALKQELSTHGDQVTTMIDDMVAGNYNDLYAVEHQAFEHMTDTSLTLVVGAKF